MEDFKDRWRELNLILLNSIKFKPDIISITPDYENIIDVQFYFYSIRDFSSKAIQTVTLFGMKFSSDQFCSFVKACKHVQNLNFVYCNIITDSECEFGELRGSKIQNLCFEESGGKEFSDWIDHRERFFNILEGINRCQNLKSHLLEVSLQFGCDELVMTGLKSDIERMFPWLRSTNKLFFSIEQI